MSSIQEEEEIILKLAKLRLSISQKLISKEYNYGWILQKLGNINDQVLATANLESHNPQLIGCAALHFALSSKNIEALEILLSHGADFTAKNQAGSTALHLAIEQLYSCPCCITKYPKTQFQILFVTAILKAHLQYKIFENPCDRNGFSHFHAACMLADRELVELFLANGVPIDDAVNKDWLYFPGYTPLHFAAKFCALDAVGVLLKHGANRNLRDAQGSTPLQLLLEKSIKYVKSTDEWESGSVRELMKSRIGKIIRFFVEDVGDGDTMVIDEFGFSQFHLICTTNDLQSIEHYSNKVVNIDHAVSMDSPLYPGYSGLHFAALFSVDTVKLLLEKGASFEVEDAKGVTPFDLCLELYQTEEIHAILSLHPIWKDVVFGNSKSKSTNVVLRSNSTKLVDLVLATRDANEFVTFVRTVVKKANIFIPTKSSLWPGFTPLHVAVSLCKNSDDLEKWKSIFTVLCDHGADLNSQDARGRTPINLAYRQNKPEIVKLLMGLYRWGDPSNIADEDGLTHLHIFCAVSDLDTLPSLIFTWLPAIADVNAVYEGRSPISHVTTGSTPLHVAVAASLHQCFIAQKLVLQGAHILAKDSRGMTPIHLMLRCQNRDMHGREFAATLLRSQSLRDSVAEDIQLSHLHVACYANNEDAVDRLIQLGADVNKAIVRRTDESVDSYFDRFVGFTPLHFAVANRNPKIVGLLVQRGADVLAKRPNGMTPLHTNLTFDKGSPRHFASVLKGDADLQKRVETEVGLTMLHVACRLVDVDMAKDLLVKGANVNAQIHSDSPIWPGFAPLHVWARVVYVRRDQEEPRHESILKLLLEYGADVYLGDAARDTPLHIVCKNWTYNYKETFARCTITLLQAHRNFRVNPANASGISHFHLACALGEVSIVEEFLKHRGVDVNKSVDYFSNIMGCCAPLHLAVMYRYLRPAVNAHLGMVDLLLRYGANVNADDCFGDTPLHEVANRHSTPEDLLERLVREGADVNRHNIKGETPLELLLRKTKLSIDKIRYFMKCGCRMNAINPVTGQSYWALVLSSVNFEALQYLVFQISINFPDLLMPDEEGRKIIHNIVSASPQNISEIQYSQIIQKILKTNDVDDQDKSGKTPLHIAVGCFNEQGVSILLNAGADIDIVDSLGQSALTNVFNINVKQKQTKTNHATVKKLVVHVNKLLFCGLFVSQINLEELTRECCQKVDVEVFLGECFKHELEQVKNVKIGSYSLTLGDFLSELGAVSDYPTMSQVKRETIDKFFTSINGDFLEKYSRVVGLLRLQYRKALARGQLVKKANESLTVCVGFRLPDICSQIILKLLINSELTTLIAATFQNEANDH